jgi:hypothetical protein
MYDDKLLECFRQIPIFTGSIQYIYNSMKNNIPEKLLFSWEFIRVKRETAL